MPVLTKSRRWVVPIVMSLVGHCAYTQIGHSGARADGAAGESSGNPVTAVAGESWLVHLHRPLSETSMGKTGRLGPPAAHAAEETAHWLPALSSVTAQNVTLYGFDLYRLNCRGCHGESGQGAPPEINSVINPVRATSVALVMERMKTAGIDISRADATKLAQESNAALLQRLHRGGQNMPPFPHLNDAEIASLIAYLKQLAGIPGAEKEQVAVRESAVRVGEHIVKSTCHTCHSAAGLDPDPQQIWDGAIPPLSTLTRRKSQPDFIAKVTHGAPIRMGTPPMLYRGRMPVFYYLSEEEAADVYLYLTSYPPSESSIFDTTIALSQQGPTTGGGATPPQKARGRTSLPAPDPRQHAESSDLQNIALLSMVAALVILLLAAGLGFTMREFQRLSAANHARGLTLKPRSQGRTDDATATFQHVS